MYNVTAANGKTFTYDSQNELVSMNDSAVQIVYDGDGNRVVKAVTSGGVTTTTYYLVDDLNPTDLPQVMDELTNGVVTRTYTYGLQRVSEDQFVNGTWTPSFYSYDGMGSVRQLTSMAGAVTDSYEYDAFGNQITHTGSTPNNMLYRGEQWDPDLGLYYLRARYYNPLTGRFMSRDPNSPPIIGPGIPTDPRSLHKYLYADGDPLDFIDPLGQAAAAEYDMETYGSLRRTTAFTNLEAHHILQARFATVLGYASEDDMMAIAVDNLEHDALDLAWRDWIPYGTTSAATQEDVLEAALEIYVDYPEVMEWLRTAWAF